MAIDKKAVKLDRRKRPDSKKATLRIGIRISPDISKFLKENSFSPTAIFYEALKELGYKER